MYKRDLCNRDFKMKKEKLKLDINLMFKILKKDLMLELKNYKILWKECPIEVNYLIPNGYKNLERSKNSTSY